MPKPTFERGVNFLKELEVHVSDDARKAIVQARAVLDRSHTVDGELVPARLQLGSVTRQVLITVRFAAREEILRAAFFMPRQTAAAGTDRARPRQQ